MARKQQTEIPQALGSGVVFDRVDIASLKADDRNARRHSERNIGAVVESLRRFGQQKPVVVDRDGRVLAGNATLAAAKILGWERLDIARTSLSGDEATAYAIADNRTAELAEWDDEVLMGQLASIAKVDTALLESTGFDEADLAAFAAKDEEAISDEFPSAEKDAEHRCPSCGYTWN